MLRALAILILILTATPAAAQSLDMRCDNAMTFAGRAPGSDVANAIIAACGSPEARANLAADPSSSFWVVQQTWTLGGFSAARRVLPRP